MYLSCHTLYTHWWISLHFMFTPYYHPWDHPHQWHADLCIPLASLHTIQESEGKGRGGLLYLGGVAYWGQGCFLLTWVIWGNTNLYGITKRTYTYMTVHSCLILILPNKLHISGNIKSNWQSESGPDTMYFTVV